MKTTIHIFANIVLMIVLSACAPAMGSSTSVPPEDETLDVSTPTPLLPNGATTTHNPFYKWTKATNATYYNIQLYNFDGTKRLYNKVVSSKTCATTTCRFKPTKQFLGDGNYKWRVRAKIGGVWKPFSEYKAFNVAKLVD